MLDWTCTSFLEPAVRIAFPIISARKLRGVAIKRNFKKFKECGRDEVHPLPGINAQLPGMVNRYRELGQILYAQSMIGIRVSTPCGFYASMVEMIPWSHFMPSATPLTNTILHMILVFFMRCTKILLTRSCLRGFIGSRRGGLGSGEKPPVGVGRVDSK